MAKRFLYAVTKEQMAFPLWGARIGWRYNAAMLMQVLTKWSTFSWLVLGILLLVLGASVWVFVTLVRRTTTRRYELALSDWAEEHGFALHHNSLTPLPAPLAALAERRPRTRWAMSKEPTALLQLEMDAKTPDGTEPAYWNVLVWPMSRSWEPAALRPAHALRSLVDFFNLSPFPTLMDGQRFVVCGSDRLAARTLARSPARTLLPADLGLLVLKDHLILDFSARPFDEIELTRMQGLIEQLAQHLGREAEG